MFENKKDTPQPAPRAMEACLAEIFGATAKSNLQWAMSHFDRNRDVMDMARATARVVLKEDPATDNAYG